MEASLFHIWKLCDHMEVVERSFVYPDEEGHDGMALWFNENGWSFDIIHFVTDMYAFGNIGLDPLRH